MNENACRTEYFVTFAFEILKNKRYMTLVILAILLLAYILIATENVTKVNRAAVAIFAGTVGWVLYICFGMDFVASEHSSDYSKYLNLGLFDEVESTSTTVKYFIARNIFLPYVGRAAEIVLFLLATMTIVEILNNNGCFDFVRQLLRTRSSKKMLWILAVVTFVISANLDNLTTTVMMLTLMHGVIPNRRQRMVYGSVILLSANCGGTLTVIGNPEGLVLWNMGAVTATRYSLSLLAPCLAAWLIPTFLMQRMLPERVETEWIVMPYRGDDTRLNVWQRLLMLFVGIGGLWFIPTFHNITKLSPFLGALCVLSVLWIVNEIFNRKLMNMDAMTQRRTPQVLQYGAIQMILFVMGIMLAVAVVKETGAFDDLSSFLGSVGHHDGVWLHGVVAGVASTVLDNFATAMNFFSLHDVASMADPSAGVLSDYDTNGIYWQAVAYCVMAGGNVLGIGTISGLALMKMERMRMGWYFRNIGWKALMGGVVGLAILWLSHILVAGATSLII